MTPVSLGWNQGVGRAACPLEVLGENPLPGFLLLQAAAWLKVPWLRHHLQPPASLRAVFQVASSSSPSAFKNLCHYIGLLPLSQHDLPISKSAT